MSSRNTLDGATVLLTGATGLIGGELLLRLLDTPVERIYCLVRGESNLEAERRLRRRFGSNGSGDTGYSGRVIPIVGDLTRDGLGLSCATTRNLQAQVSVVVHCAGETSFIRHRECRHVNVDGLQRLLDLTATFRRPALFTYFGSAAACGDRRQVLLHEEDYPQEQDAHFLDYTMTKSIAERLLRNERSVPNWLILRPSIVVPDTDAPDELLRGVAWALILMNEVSALPLNRDSNIDVVPLSFVGECAIRLIGNPDRRHRCYHISSGRRARVTWGDVMATLKDTFGRDEETRCLDNEQWKSIKKSLTRRERKLVGAVSCYFPFINQSVMFDNERLYSDCSDPSPRLREFREYLPGLLRRISLDDALRESENP